MPPTRGMLRGPRDPQSYRASLLRGGGREQQDQSFAFNPPSRNLRAAVAGEGKKLTAAGLGLVQRTPRPEGERWEMQRNTIPRGTALPCPAAPACGQGGSDPQPPTGSQRCFLPPTCWALRTANQGLIFALQRGLEAFRLQKRHARVFGPAAGPSVPATPARLMFHPPPPRAPASRPRRAASGRLMGTGGRNTGQTPAFLASGSKCSQTEGGRAARTVLFTERGSAHPWSREVCRRTSLYLQWYFIYSRVCLARAV